MVMTISILCEGGFTKVAAESLTLMNSSDVHITSSNLCEGSFTKITVESLTLMDSFDVLITTTIGCERGVTFSAAMYFLHFYINTGELLVVWCLILY